MQEKLRVGIIGGGQLAQMMAIASKPLGITTVVLAETPDAPALGDADEAILGGIGDRATVAQLAAITDIITFENEFVDLDGLQQLAEGGTQFRPSLEILRMAVDKRAQRQYFESCGMPTPMFYTVQTAAELLTAADRLGFPLVLKSRRLGYDGKGTAIVAGFDRLLSIWEAMGSPPAIAEAFVPFERELAVIAARSATGEIVIYPVVETLQVDQVCRRTIAPARIDDRVKEQVEQIAIAMLSGDRSAAGALGGAPVVGVFGIEYFLTGDGKVSVNEIAPRTHNSGHYTIESCVTSQFEQLMRIAAGLPLGAVDMKVPVAAMVNLLGLDERIARGSGDYTAQRATIAQFANVSLHWYGKSHSKPGRKLGHVTILGNTYAEVESCCDRIEEIWYGSLSNKKTV